MQSSISNVAALLIVKGSTTGLRIVALLLLARNLAPAVFGVIVLIFTVAEVLRVLCDMGLDAYLLRAHSLSDKGIPLFTILLGKIAVIVILVPLVFLVCRLASVDLDNKSLLWALAFAFSPLLQNLGAVLLQAKNALLGLAKYYFAAFLFAVVGIWFMASRVEYWVALSFLLSVELLVALVSYWRASEISAAERDVSILKIFGHYRLSFPLGVAILLGALYMKFDVLLLSRWSSAEQLGIYGLALRVLEPILFVGGAFYSDAYARMSATRSGAVDVFQSQRKFLQRTAWAGGAATVFYAGCAVLLLHYLMPEYRGLWLVLVILCCVTVVRLRNMSLTSFINSRGAFKVMTRLAAFNLLLTMAFLGALVHLGGMVGAACAMLAVEVINVLIQKRVVAKLATAD